MRTHLTLSLFAVSSLLAAQLQNGGFEALDPLNMPTYWSTGIEFITVGDSIVVDSAKYVLNSTDVHGGSYAAELRNAYNVTQGFGSPGVWYASPFEQGYQGFPSPNVPVVERPQTVRFWAKYAPVSGDTGYVEVNVINEQQEEIGLGTLRISDEVDTYTAFDVPIDYSSADSAVAIRVRFTTMVPGGNAHLGTRMLIDDVSIAYMTTDVAEVKAAAVSLFPNPAADEVRLVGLDGGSATSVRVLDATGRVLADRQLTNGRLSLIGMASGTHLIQIVTGDAIYNGRLVITR